MYSRSLDGGKSFSPPRQLVSGDSIYGTQGFIASNGKCVYLLYVARTSPIDGTLAVERSTDGGTTWLPRTDLGNHFPYGIDARDSMVYVYCDYDDTIKHSLLGEILASHDFGDSWRLASLGIPDAGYPTVHRLAAGPAGPHLLFQAGITAQEVGYIHSEDLGLTWSLPETLSTIDDYASQAPDVVVGDAEHVYVAWNDGKYDGIYGTQLFTGTILMRRSVDGGHSWLPEQIISEPVIASFSKIAAVDSILCAVWGTQVPGIDPRGIFTMEASVSSDYGQSFCPPDTLSLYTFSTGGDPWVSVTKDAIHACWWREDSTSYVAELFSARLSRSWYGFKGQAPPFSGSVALLQNYPNPVNSETRIFYGLDARSYVNLTMYNCLGQRLSVLVDDFEGAGEHSVTWKADRYASGVYFYRLETLGKVVTQRLVLIK
jgi:hypothetical protein